MSSHLNFIRRGLFALFSITLCAAQNQISVFENEIRGIAPGSTSAELLNSTTLAIAGHTTVDNDGNFVMHDIEPGRYVLRLVSAPGHATARPAEDVQISIGDESSAKDRPSGSTVSAASLASPPSKKALKFLAKAQQYSAAGDSEKALETLRKAPMDSASAPYLHSRIGTEYLKTGRYALAEPELKLAAELAPKDAAHHSNLAYVYQALGKLDMAEAEARKALQMEGSNAKAHFLLGSALLGKPGFQREAMENLKAARNEVPSARFLLAQVYLLSGQKEAAEKEINSFLEVASESQKATARQWVEQHRAP